MQRFNAKLLCVEDQHLNENTKYKFLIVLYIDRQIAMMSHCIWWWRNYSSELCSLATSVHSNKSRASSCTGLIVYGSLFTVFTSQQPFEA